MNIDAIVGKIAEDAVSHAAHTMQVAREKAEALRAQSDADIASAKQAVISDAQTAAQQLRERMLRMAELDERKETLAMKREVIDLAFEKAVSALLDMPAEQAAHLNIQLLLEAAQGDEELIIDARNEDLFTPAFLQQANEALIRAGKQGKVALSVQRRTLSGGFVLSRGGMEINCAYDTVLRIRRTALEGEVAMLLFA